MTPLPQPGNPKPRMFRLSPTRRVINRLGFNNEGHAAALARLQARGRPRRHRRRQYRRQQGQRRPHRRLRAADRRFAAVARYFTVNVSSPNTPGLRDLQQGRGWTNCWRACSRRASALAERRPPVLLKIAPDLRLGDLDAVVASRAPRVDGMIVSNTTIRGRPTLRTPQRRASRAGFSGSRCFRSRRACWPRRSCGPRARSR